MTNTTKSWYNTIIEGDNVTNRIRKMLEYLNITQTELGRRMGTTFNNINNKLKRDNFSVKDLQQIADALGVELIIKFKTENGTEF